MTGVLGKTGLAPAGMTRFSRQVVATVNPIPVRNAMSRVSGKSAGMSAIGIAGGRAVVGDLAENASGVPAGNARRDVSMLTEQSILGIRAAMTSRRSGGLFHPGGIGSLKFLASPTLVRGAFDNLSSEVRAKVSYRTSRDFQSESDFPLLA